MLLAFYHVNIKKKKASEKERKKEREKNPKPAADFLTLPTTGQLQKKKKEMIFLDSISVGVYGYIHT